MCMLQRLPVTHRSRGCTGRLGPHGQQALVSVSKDGAEAQHASHRVKGQAGAAARSHCDHVQLRRLQRRALKGENNNSARRALTWILTPAITAWYVWLSAVPSQRDTSVLVPP